MKTTVLGRSGIKVSAIGLGCWAIGGPFWEKGGWIGYGDVDDAESARAIRRALELGVTFFDTANVYGCGHSERILGQTLAEHAGGLPVVVTSKFGYQIDETKRHVLGADASPTAIRASCEASLRRLRREAVDLFQFHLYDYPLDQAVEVRETLESLVAEGKIRAYAWCSEDPARIRLFAEGKHCTAVPQLLNVLESNPAALALCAEHHLAVVARRPLGMGLFTGKYGAGSTFAENDMRTRFGWNLRDGKQAAQLVQLIALRESLTRGGRTLAQGALAWILEHHPGSIPIPGFKTVAQVEENARAIEVMI